MKADYIFLFSFWPVWYLLVCSRLLPSLLSIASIWLVMLSFVLLFSVALCVLRGESLLAFEWRLITFSGLAFGWVGIELDCWRLHLHCYLSPAVGECVVTSARRCEAHLTSKDGGNAEKCLEHFLPWPLYGFKQRPCLTASSISLSLAQRVPLRVTSPWNRNSQPYLHLFSYLFDLALLGSSL